METRGGPTGARNAMIVESSEVRMMKSRILHGLSTLVALVVLASEANAQSVEFVFTQAGLMDALEYKEDLQYDEAVSTNAISLLNVPQARLDAYLAGTQARDAVIVFGEGARKAISDVPYQVPVIVVGAVGGTSAQTTIHVMDSDFGGAAQNVANAAAFSLPAGASVTLKCVGVEVLAVVQAVVAQLASRR